MYKRHITKNSFIKLRALYKYLLISSIVKIYKEQNNFVIISPH